MGRSRFEPATHAPPVLKRKCGRTVLAVAPAVNAQLMLWMRRILLAVLVYEVGPVVTVPFTLLWKVITVSATAGGTPSTPITIDDLLRPSFVSPLSVELVTGTRPNGRTIDVWAL